MKVTVFHGSRKSVFRNVSADECKEVLAGLKKAAASKGEKDRPNVADLVPLIEKAETVEAVAALVHGDDRVTVIKAGEKRINELKSA